MKKPPNIFSPFDEKKTILLQMNQIIWFDKDVLKDSDFLMYQT